MRELGLGHLAPPVAWGRLRSASQLSLSQQEVRLTFPSQAGQGAEEMCVFSSHPRIKREREMENG